MILRGIRSSLQHMKMEMPHVVTIAGLVWQVFICFIVMKAELMPCPEEQIYS